MKTYGLIIVDDNGQWDYKQSEDTAGTLYEGCEEEILAHVSHLFKPGTYFYEIELTLRRLQGSMKT